MQAVILLICSTILTFFVRELEGIDLLHGKLMKNPKLLLEKQNVLGKCFCLPVNNGGKSVSEVISPKGNYKGRLVVYLYKNLNNQLTVYVPNREKQLAIPDLTLDEGETLEKITNSKMKDLFETSSFIVVPKPGEQLTDYGYINFNLNKHLNELININENQKKKEPILPQNIEQQGIKVTMNMTEDNMHINPDKLLQIPGGSLQIPGGSLQIPGGSFQIPFPIKPQQPSEINNQKHQSSTQNINAEIQLGITDQKQPGTIFGPSIGTKPNRKVVVKPSPNKGKLVIIEDQPNSATVNPNKNVQGSIVQESGPQDVSYNLLPMKKFNLNFPNEHNTNIATLFPHRYRPPKHTLSNKMSFDQWLVEQINLLQLHKPFMYYSIDINALKLVILRALQNNGISVSSTGVLKDSNGKIVQISNLELQPILLSDPIEYEKLLALNKCILPYNLPYLKAMFVTLNYPPQILGIIYLGDSYHKCSHGLCPQKTRCLSNQCKQSPDLAHIVEITSPDGYKPNLNNKLLGTFSRRLNDDLEQSDDNSIQQLIPDSALEPLPDDSISRPKNEEVNDENKQDLDDDFSYDDNKVDDAGDYDDLGIRIIGGQPATASGTPITSKGRSGYYD